MLISSNNSTYTSKSSTTLFWHSVHTKSEQTSQETKWNLRPTVQEQQVSSRHALGVQGWVRVPWGVPARGRSAAEGRLGAAAEGPATGGGGGGVGRDNAGGGSAGLPRLVRAGHADSAAAAAAAEDFLGGRATTAALNRAACLPRLKVQSYTSVQSLYPPTFVPI